MARTKTPTHTHTHTHMSEMAHRASEIRALLLMKSDTFANYSSNFATHFSAFPFLLACARDAAIAQLVYNSLNGIYVHLTGGVVCCWCVCLSVCLRRIWRNAISVHFCQKPFCAGSTLTNAQFDSNEPSCWCCARIGTTENINFLIWATQTWDPCLPSTIYIYRLSALEMKPEKWWSHAISPYIWQEYGKWHPRHIYCP